MLDVRRMLVPDPGMVMLDCDLTGADAQVVAWECNDLDLMTAFQKGIKIHAHNALAMFGPAGPCGPDGKREPTYSRVKQAVHGTNYGASASTIAAATGWSVQFCMQFQARWFALHPSITEWHRETEHALATSRKVVNQFGFHRVYFERDALTEALAWVPQSTVAIVCDRGARAVWSNAPARAEVLMQVHDSVVLQIPYSSWEARDDIHFVLLNAVPYSPTPLLIQWGLKASRTSWSNCRPVSWSGPEEMPA